MKIVGNSLRLFSNVQNEAGGEINGSVREPHHLNKFNELCLWKSPVIFRPYLLLCSFVTVFAVVGVKSSFGEKNPDFLAQNACVLSCYWLCYY